MGEVIESYNGEIVNYMGDGLMALFGLRQRNNPALDAAQASLEMLKALEKDNYYFEAAYGQDLNIRIGIHYGPVVVGGLGAKERQQKSAIGDAVNFASRIEEANKMAGTKLLVSEDVYHRIERKATVGKQLSITPKGKTGEYPLFEIVSLLE
jgi:adenylate cyclase